MGVCKVIPITGRHTTLHSMLAQAMADERAERGYVIWFEKDGTMQVGHVAATLGDACLASAYLQRDVVLAMGEEGP